MSDSTHVRLGAPVSITRLSYGNMGNFIGGYQTEEKILLPATINCL